MIHSKYRISSFLNSHTIGVLPKGIYSFCVSELEINKSIKYTTNKPIRLGKEIEKVFSVCVKASLNYQILYENIQIMDGKTTIGELDFIVKDLVKEEVFHLELVYKFYLYDPDHSNNELEKWIGPNRKDSFIEKYNKLKNKQFPLLYNQQTKLYLEGIKIEELDQKLCFIASLFVPYHLFGQSFSLINNKAIVGYWQSINDFENHQCETTQFYLPQKSEWGISPKHNTNWESLSYIIKQIKDCHSRQFSPLCWVKMSETRFEQCFIVWW